MPAVRICVSFEFDKDKDLRSHFYIVRPRSIRYTEYRTARFDKTIRPKCGELRRERRLADVTS